MNSSLKERLNTLRTNKTLVWQTSLVTMGGVLGLFVKMLNAGTNRAEITLMLVGFSLFIFLIYLISCISDEMEYLQNQLKKEK